MEGAPEPAPKPSRRRRVVLVLIVAAVVVAAGFVVWWAFIRPRTIAEVFAFDHFQPGASVTVQGTITGIDRENTSYGPRVSLQLDGNTLCAGSGDVFGDPNATYRVGETFQTMLHFQSYTLNGDPAVSAPELACPFPLGFTGIGHVIDAVGVIAGLTLVYNGTAAGGWQAYRFVARNGAAYNPAVLPATLRESLPVGGNNPALPAGGTVDSAARWNTLLSLQYVALAGQFSAFPSVDHMASLASPSSANGTLRFIDADHNGLVDDGDRIDVRLPPTASASTWDTYLLEVGSMGSAAPTYVAASHYIVNGPQGPLETLATSRPTLLDFRYAGTQPGPPLRSAIQAAGLSFGSAPAVSTTEYDLLLPSNGTTLSGPLAGLPAVPGSGISLAFADRNGDGFVDAGDTFTLSGVANHTRVTLTLSAGGFTVAFVEWIVGYGMPVPFIPNFSFAATGSGPWTITATVPTWSPELAFNRTVRATLLENGRAVLTNVSLANGTVGTFANGTLSFTDADGDGTLSTGDFFTLTGNPTAPYELEVSVLFQEWTPPVDV